MNEIETKTVKYKVASLRAFAALAPAVAAVVKEYDGKQFNKKFDAALREVKSQDGQFFCGGYGMNDYSFCINLTKNLEYKYISVAHVIEESGQHPWAKLIGKTERVNAFVIIESINENAKNLLKRADKIEKQMLAIDSMINEYNEHIDVCNNLYRELDPAFDSIFRNRVHRPSIR